MKNTPSSRESFERNMHLLVHRVKSGTFGIPRNSPVVDQLLKVRKLPNGRLDLLSVDEGARLLANTVADMEGRMAWSQGLKAESPPPVDARQADNQQQTPAINPPQKPQLPKHKEEMGTSSTGRSGRQERLTPKQRADQRKADRRRTKRSDKKK